MKQKKILAAALAAALTLSLTAPALAMEPMTTDGTRWMPVYELVQRGASFPTRVWGSAAELGEMSLTLERSGEEGQQKVVVNVAPDTVLLDAATGEARTFGDIRAGETVCAWVGPEMTQSLPPITTARLILCGIPADFAVPTYAEVERVTETPEGMEVSVSGDVVLRLSADTEYLSAPGWEGEGVSGADIVPGTRLLSWYTAATMSIPAQAAPTKVMVFPSNYSGWVSVDGLKVAVNGEALPLEGASAARVEDGRLMVPVRLLAETLGCEVTWEAYINQVSVSKGGSEIYHFTIGGEQAAKGDVTVGLVSIWFAVGSLGALAAAALGGGLWLQIVIFLLLSALSLMLLKPLSRKWIIGETALVTEDIDNTMATGQVRVDGQIWTARSAHGVVIPAGSRVKVLSIQGVKVMVELA